MGGRVDVTAVGGPGVEKLSGAKLEIPVVLGRFSGLERPIVRGGGLMATAALRGGGGVLGGVVSIPLSSIILP